MADTNAETNVACNLPYLTNAAAGEASDPNFADNIQNKILKFKIKWENYDQTRGHALTLKTLNPEFPAFKIKAIIEGGVKEILSACMDVLTIKDDKPVQWLLSLFYHICRTDGSSFGVFEEGMKAKVDLFKPLMTLLKRPQLHPYTADKAAWLLSGIIGNSSRFFAPQQVHEFVDYLYSGGSETTCTAYGVLDATANLLKTDDFRTLVWGYAGVQERILNTNPQKDSPSVLYKCIFCLWMLSYDEELTLELKEQGVMAKIKEIMSSCRVEKVIRLSLTVLKNFLNCKALCEDMVEEKLLEVCEQLEYEKWRDAELYEEVRDVCRLISSEVTAFSSFDRYERELQSGTLKWGYVHSNKFWQENVRQFDNGKALKLLTGLLASEDSDPTTLAVACHDLGEFVAIHPLGKKLLQQYQVKPVKERVMKLMSEGACGNDQEMKEVRREALLCCQKLMLVKWQDMK